MRLSTDITPADEFVVADYGDVKLFTAGTGNSNYALSEEEIQQAISEWPFATLAELSAALASLGQERLVDPINGFVPFCTIFPDGSCRNATNNSLVAPAGAPTPSTSTLSPALSETSSAGHCCVFATLAMCVLFVKP